MRIEIDDFDIYSMNDMECYRFGDSKYGAMAKFSMIINEFGEDEPLYKTAQIISFSDHGFKDKTYAHLFVKMDEDYAWLCFARKPPVRIFNRLFKKHGVEFKTGSVTYDGEEYELKRGTAIKMKLR